MKNSSLDSTRQNVTHLDVNNFKLDVTLEVVIDTEAKCRSHTVNVVNEACRILGLVKATYTWLGVATARPHLEYGTPN